MEVWSRVWAWETEGGAPESRYQGKTQSKTLAWRFPRDATVIPSDPGRI